MDAAYIRAPSLAELDLYCDRVASAVGRLSVRAFGVPTAAADRVAHALGRALQLTNILRDLAEDGDRGRLYLPRELLQAEGISATDPATVLKHPGLLRVCSALATMAEGRFLEARAAMAAVYHAILGRLCRRGWRDIERAVKVPKALKLWFALRYGML
jgi:phytoene synthase